MPTEWGRRPSTLAAHERSRAMKRRAFLGIAASSVGLLWGSRRLLAGPVTTDAIGDMVQTVPKGELPQFAGAGTPDIRRLYQYAVDHGDELQYIPCTCGCARVGHKSNLACYIKSVNKDGTLTFTSHAAT